MANLVLLFGAVHDYGVEAVVGFQPGVLLDEVGGDFIELALLGRRNTLLRRAESGGPSGFHLYEYYPVPLPGNDVDFAPLGAEIAHQDGKSLFDQEANCDFLPPFAEVFARLRHFPSITPDLLAAELHEVFESY